MACNYVSSTSFKGTKYRINYAFKAGAKYFITIVAAEKTSTAGTPTAPYLRLDITNSGGGFTNCTGPGSIDQALSGNPPPRQIGSTTDMDYTFPWATPLTSANTGTTLEASSIPATNGGTNAIRIKKTTIEETLPTPSFSTTTSPSSL